MYPDNVIKLQSFNRWLRNLRTTVHTAIRSDHFTADQVNDELFHFSSPFDKGGTIIAYVAKQNPSLCSLEGGPGDNRLFLTASDSTEAEMVLRSLEREWDKGRGEPELASEPE